MKKQSHTNVLKLFFMMGLILCIPLISAQPQTTIYSFPQGYTIVPIQYEQLKAGEDFAFFFYLKNTSSGLLIDNTTAECNFYMTDSQGNLVIYQQEVFQPNGFWTTNISGSNVSQAGYYYFGVDCEDGLGGSLSGVFEVTPTGKAIENEGAISVGILYFFLAMGFGLMFAGYALLNNKSIFISYGGLFVILLGCTFLFYDLHLANFYANTIAINSGAGNVTTGVFLLVMRLIKLSPYIIAGVIAFASVRLLKKAIKKKSNTDGWDNGEY